MYTYLVGDFNSSWRNVYSYGVKTQPGEIDRIIALDRNGKVKGPALGGGRLYKHRSVSAFRGMMAIESAYGTTSRDQSLAMF